MAAPTHRRIAALARVSQATVSLALRNHPRISAATRERVAAIAARLDYRTTPLVSALMAQQRTTRPVHYRATLGFVYTQVRRDIRTDEIVSRYFRGAAARALELGYTLEPFWLTAPGMNEKRLSEILVHRGIHGLILAALALQPPPGAAQLCAGRMALDWPRFSAVALGATLREPDLDRTTHDNFRGMSETVRRLRSAGFRRIGLAMSPQHDQRVNHLWLAGFLAFSHALPRAEQVPPFVPTAERWAIEPFAAWFERHEPDALVSVDVAPRDWLLTSGHARRRRLGYASCRWLPGRGCAGWYQNYEQIGAAATDLVVGKLHRNERGVPAQPHELLIKGRWMDGSFVIEPVSGRAPLRAVASNPVCRA